MQKRWSICDIPQGGMQEFGTPLEQKRQEDEQCSAPTSGPVVSGDEISGGAKTCDNFEGYPLRKCRSSFDLAMDSLRREIVSSAISIIWLITSILCCLHLFVQLSAVFLLSSRYTNVDLGM